MFKQSFAKSITILSILILALGIFFRFANLDRKVYWGDEAFTSLRISGYSLTEFQQRVFSGKEINVVELQKYQYPNSEKKIIDTVKGLAKEEPQHPPLYFVMAKFWVQLFGNSITATRSFPAIIGLLALPCIYWLTQELFKSPFTSAIAVALMAVSPLHILYSQESRSYSLWTVTILLSSASLLRAMRLQTKLSWGIYAVTLAMGLYTILFSVLVGIGHGIYVFINESFRFTKTVKNYLLSSFAGLLMFLPWLLVLSTNLSKTDETTTWNKTIVPLKSLVKTWLLNLSRVFFDLNNNFSDRDFFFYLVIITLLILVGYSIYFLCRYSDRQVWLFLLLLLGVTALAAILPDLVLGGRRSSVTRYLLPCYLSIQITVAHLLATKIAREIIIKSKRVAKWRQKLWQIIFALLISGGILSSAVSSQAEAWWHKSAGIYQHEIATIINQSDRPILISTWHWLLPLSHVLNDNVSIQPLVSQNPVMLNANADSDVFVLSSSKAVKQLTEQHNYYIKQKYLWQQDISPVDNIKIELWKLAKDR